MHASVHVYNESILRNVHSLFINSEIQESVVQSEYLCINFISCTHEHYRIVCGHYNYCVFDVIVVYACDPAITNKM